MCFSNRISTGFANNWDFCIISLHTRYSGLLGQGQETIQKVIAHEMGHALKLAHPSDVGYANTNTSTDGNHSVLAIMNQNPPNQNNYVTVFPSAHDINAINKKWN